MIEMNYTALPRQRPRKLQPLPQQSYNTSQGTFESLGFQAHKSILEKNKIQLFWSTIKSCNQWDQSQKASAADLYIRWHNKKEELMLKVAKRKPLHRILYTVLQESEMIRGFQSFGTAFLALLLNILYETVMADWGRGGQGLQILLSVLRPCSCAQWREGDISRGTSEKIYEMTL